MQNLSIPKQPYELPTAYTLALIQMAKCTGKDPKTIIIEALDLWLDKHNQIGNSPELKQQEQPKNPITPICSSQLDVIPTGETYGLLLENDEGYLLENKPYPDLAKALNQIKEYEKIGHTNLNNWNPISGEYPLVILQKPGGLPHIWLGQNSACKIFNNKDVKPNSFKLTTNHPTQNICKSCVNNFKEICSPKVHLSFDSKKRLLPPDIQSFNRLF